VIASGSAELAARVVAATPRDARPLIALDHDGTLSAIVQRPEDAVLAEGASAALERLAAHVEVVIVSGRGLDDLERRFERHRVALVSEHGLRCRLPDGTVEQLTDGIDPAELDRVRAALHELLGDAPGWLIEDKGVSIAVHHRLVESSALRPDLERVRELLESAAEGDADEGGYVQEGKAVLELRPAGADKGAALRWLAARTSARPVIMVGDDVTDEPALLAAEELGGIGVLVATSPGPTSASARLLEPDDVVAFLDHLAAQLAGRSGERPVPLS
jgi:trehalose-phosphatase